MKGHRIGAKQKIGLTVSFVGTGIVICGLNGAGKSTLGKALAEKLDFYFIDNEDLFFPKTDPNYIYASPRTHEETEKMLFHAIKVHENFVFAAFCFDFSMIRSSHQKPCHKYHHYKKKIFLLHHTSSFILSNTYEWL